MNANDILEAFKHAWPYDFDHMIGYQQFDDESIIVDLDDGTSIVFDMYRCSTRKLPDNSDCMNEDQFRREFGHRLQMMLNRKGVTQRTFAERIGATESQLSNYIRGKSTPSFYTMDRICRELGCRSDYFRYTERG